MMKYTIFFTLLAATTVYAYQSVPRNFVISNPLVEAQNIERSPLKMKRLEEIEKSALARKRILFPAEFFQLKAKSLENSELYQSWIEEVNEALWGKNLKANPKDKINYYEKFVENTRIDLAKKIAKRQMLLLLKNNWNKVKETIFNEYVIEKWSEAEIEIHRLLNERFIYVPRPQQNTYLFMLGDSFVEIDKQTLKRGHAALDINSRLDGNIIPDVEIIADDADQKSKPAQKKENIMKNTNEKPALPAKDESPSSNDAPELEIF